MLIVELLARDYALREQDLIALEGDLRDFVSGLVLGKLAFRLRELNLVRTGIDLDQQVAFLYRLSFLVMISWIAPSTRDLTVVVLNGVTAPMRGQIEIEIAATGAVPPKLVSPAAQLFRRRSGFGRLPVRVPEVADDQQDQRADQPGSPILAKPARIAKRYRRRNISLWSGSEAGAPVVISSNNSHSPNAHTQLGAVKGLRVA